MLSAKYTAKFGESIFDVAIKLYGSVDSAVKLFFENYPTISEFEEDIEGITLIFDPLYKQQNSTVLLTIKPPDKNLSQIYKPTDYQTIFDVALMLNGNLDSIFSLVRNSTLNNINTEIKISDSFIFVKKRSGILDWIEKTGQIFQTKTPLEGNTDNEHNKAFDRLSHT